MRGRTLFLLALVTAVLAAAVPGAAYAQAAGAPGSGGIHASAGGGSGAITLTVPTPDGGSRGSFAVEIVLAMTVLSLAPAILIMLTSFTRIVVVMSFLRQALGTQQMPPGQLIIGLSLFLTMVVMMPVLRQVNDTALQPWMRNEITQKQAYENAVRPLKAFMLEQTREKDIAMFVRMMKREKPQNRESLGMEIVVPAFILSELKTAFIMGFVIFVPFIVIDMVVSSVLMSMGILMLPPVMISLPFKILLFVLVDGWNLVVQSLLTSFH